MTLHHAGLNIDCDYCGHANAETATRCDKCQHPFTFRTLPLAQWTGGEHYSWMFAYTFQLCNKVEAQGFAALPRSQQIHFLVGYFYTQVMNGGVGQFFFNPSGPHAPELVCALQEINAPLLAGVLAPVVAKFPNGQPPQDLTERATCMDAMGDEDFWNKLDAAGLGRQHGLARRHAAANAPRLSGAGRSGQLSAPTTHQGTSTSVRPRLQRTAPTPAGNHR